MRRDPAPAALLVDLEIADAFVVAGVEVVDRGMPACDRGVAEGVEDVPAQRAAARPAIRRRRRACSLAPEEMIVVLQEERQHVVPAQPGSAELPPVVVVGAWPRM